jgi:hypothetical protein
MTDLDVMLDADAGGTLQCLGMVPNSLTVFDSAPRQIHRRDAAKCEASHPTQSR